MNRTTALVVAVSCLSTVGVVAIVLIIEFGGRDSTILIAAIAGFLTPTIGSMLTLMQGVKNSESLQATSNQVAATASTVDTVNKKVNGHLARLTQIVVDSAASGMPVDTDTASQLADHTTLLTGRTITVVPKPPDTVGNP